jgi:integrase
MSKSNEKKRQYKSGSVREIKGRFYIRYRGLDGKQKEESAGTDQKGAEKLLRQRVGEIAAAVIQPKAKADVTVEECLRLALADMERRKLASAQIAKWRMDSVLIPAIGWIKAAAFNKEKAWTYVAFRRKDGIKDSTINRDLSFVRGSMKAALEQGLIATMPTIPHLDEGDNVRTGFLTPQEYEAVKHALPDYLKPLFCVAYYTGLRRGTLLSLRLDQVDLEANLIWVSRVQVKNKKSQTSPILDGEMRGYCEAALMANHKFLFERPAGNGKRKRIRNFQYAWKKAVTLVGLPDLNFHDMRRTAVRDWINAGAPEATVMAISGHKTNSMLQRYNIIDSRVIQNAAKLRNESVAAGTDSLNAQKLREELREEKFGKPS